MALVAPVVFQIVGYQDSGKTTAMVEMVNRLSTVGYQIVTIKHHGHGGKPDVYEKKDSGRHVQAGALASLIEGEGRVLLQAEKKEWSLAEEIKIATALKPDFILIEGYKHEGFPKAVLLRDEDDLHLLEELTNIVVVLCRQPELVNRLPDSLSYPVFYHRDEGYKWMMDYLEMIHKE